MSGEAIGELKQLQSEINAALDAGNCSAVLKANEAFHVLIYHAARRPSVAGAPTGYIQSACGKPC
jgi:DNA-binding GntR family transcriptional regulator